MYENSNKIQKEILKGRDILYSRTKLYGVPLKISKVDF